MRQFGEPIDHKLDQQIRQAANQLFERMPDKRAIRGAEYVMDDEDLIVYYEAEVDLGDEERYRLGRTTPEARPPFEWHLEITSDLGESDYFKHYLIREDDIVLALGRKLTPIDEAEAQSILVDIARVETFLDQA